MKPLQLGIWGNAVSSPSWFGVHATNCRVSWSVFKNTFVSLETGMNTLQQDILDDLMTSNCVSSHNITTVSEKLRAKINNMPSLKVKF